MRSPPVEVSHCVGLEAIAVDYEWRRSFWFFRLRILVLVFIAVTRLVFFFGFGLVPLFGRRVLQDEDESLAVRRPGKILDVLNRIRELLCLAAHAVEQPNLSLALISFREKGEIFPVWAPARMRRGDFFCGHNNGIAAARRCHPDARLGLVFLEGRSRDRISHPLAVLGNLRIAHSADFKDIVYRDCPWRRWHGRSSLRGDKRTQHIRSTGQCTKRQSKWAKLHNC